MQTINLLNSSVIQVLLFVFIPFIWWVVTARKKTSFFHWIGLKKPVIKNKKLYLLSFSFTLILFLIMPFIIPLLVESTDTATSQFYGQGLSFSSLLSILIYSFVQTSLSEELFFRGFLTKRLINKFGFQTGNFIQGLTFGLMHGILFVSEVGLFKALIIILITGVIGSMLGWINEKQSDGSIVSSWLFHGLSNMFASVMALLQLG